MIIVTLDIIILLLVLFVLTFVSLKWNRIVDTKQIMGPNTALACTDADGVSLYGLFEIIFSLA